MSTEYTHLSMEKHDKCVSAAKTALFTWSAGSGAVTSLAWYVGGMMKPKIEAVNWRLKALTICVSMVTYPAYKAERAMIDCVQEYEERARLKELKRARLAAEAAAVSTSGN